VIRTVRFRQSGGFAGLVRGSEVAGGELSAPDCQALEHHLVAALARQQASSAARDLVVYELEVETDAGVSRLEFDESAVPPDLARLVVTLASRARPIPL
jgi:hypothetical protein